MGERGVSDLFRKEVSRARRNDLLDVIHLPPPQLGWTFFYIGLFAVFTTLTLLINGRYTRHEQVVGTLVPNRGLLTLTPTTPGIVTHVLVREGDKVHLGQPLFEISSSQNSTYLGDAQAAIATQLQIKRDHLQADITEQLQMVKFQRLDLSGRLTILHKQIAQIEQQITLQQQRANSSLALYRRWAEAARSGIVSEAQSLQQHDVALQNLAQVKELKGQMLQLQQQIKQLQGQLDQLPALTTIKKSNIERQLADVTQSIAQNSVQSAITLQAPADGVITNVLVHPGQSVIAQQPLGTVLPADSILQAELWVPTRAIGFLHLGDAVVIRYHAYPYQKFGQYIGHVSEISRNAMSSNAIGQLLGQDIKGSRYRVEITLDNQHILAYGQNEALKPGMTLDADILLDRRRLIEWVLEPLYGFTHGMGNGTPAYKGIH